MHYRLIIRLKICAVVVASVGVSKHAAQIFNFTTTYTTDDRFAGYYQILLEPLTHTSHMCHTIDLEIWVISKKVLGARLRFLN
jgi:hypothetical protein